MPEIGNTAKGKEIGYKNERGKFIWSACSICGKARWVAFVNSKPVNIKCRSCVMKGKFFRNKNPNWKGGKIKNGHGYILIYKGNEEYIFEHRLVMKEYLKRELKPWEIVHHFNGIKTDNRIENLILLDSKRHGEVILRLFEKIIRLESENKRLREEINK